MFVESFNSGQVRKLRMPELTIQVPVLKDAVALAREVDQHVWVMMTSQVRMRDLADKAIETWNKSLIEAKVFVEKRPGCA